MGLFFSPRLVCGVQCSAHFVLVQMLLVAWVRMNGFLIVNVVVFCWSKLLQI